MYNKNRHDVGLVRSDGTTNVGFMLALEEGLPAYRESYSKHIIDQYTLSPSAGATDPEYEMHLVQSDFSGGFGQEFMSDETRYHVSNGMDLRTGKAILGWGATAITLTNYTIASAATLVNADMELTTGWTGGARDAAQHHGGSYSWAVTGAGSAYQDAATWSATWQGKTFTVSGWIYESGSGGNAYIQLQDGVGTSDSNVTSAAAWTWVTVTRTLDAAATHLRIALIAPAGGTSYFDDIEIGSPAIGAICAHAEFNSDQYLGVGQALVKQSNSDGSLSLVRSFPAAITDLVPMQVSGTDYLFIFLGTSTPYWYMTTAEAFTRSTAAINTMQYGAVIVTTTDTMYANSTGNLIHYTPNPLNGGTAWDSPGTYVGAASESITHIQEYYGVLVIDKEDQPYYLDADGVVQSDLAPDAKSGKATHSGKNSTEWHSAYYRPTGDQALLKVGTTNTWVQPSSFGTGISDFAGQIEAVAGDEEYLYVAIDNSTKVEIVAWDDAVYHHIKELTLTGVETMWVSTAYKKGLYVSSTSSSDSLYYINLPTKYGDIVNDANASFATGGYFETSWLHANFHSTNKYFIELTLSMNHTYNASDYFTVYYKKMGDSEWTTLASFDGSSSSMIETKKLAAASVGRTTPMIKLKFVGVTGSTSRTPILLSYDLKAILYPTVRNVIECKIRCADGIKAKDGAALEEASYIKTVIEEARDSTTPIKFYDIHGATRYVKMMPITPFVETVKQPYNKNIETVYNLRLQELELV